MRTEDTRDGQHANFSRLRERKRRSNPFAATLLIPGQTRRPRHAPFSPLHHYDVITPPLLREMAILRTGQILNSEYELDQHIPLAKACGMTDAQITALPNWRASTLFDEKQRTLLAYTEAVALHDGEVDDTTYAAFANQFSPREIVELTITVITYYGTGQLTKALKVKPESDGHRSAPPKC